VAENAGMRLDRDNYNFSGRTRGRSAAGRSTSWRSRWGGASSTSRTTARRCGVLLERHDAPDRRQHRGRPVRHGRRVRGARHLLHAPREREVGTGHEVRRRLAVREGRLELPGLPEGPAHLRHGHQGCPLLYVGTTGSGESKLHDDILSGFIQDDVRPSPRLTISLGLRYDLDTSGNNRTTRTRS